MELTQSTQLKLSMVPRLHIVRIYTINMIERLKLSMVRRVHIVEIDMINTMLKVHIVDLDTIKFIHDTNITFEQ